LGKPFLFFKALFMKRIVITSGEPAGIGPDIILKLLADDGFSAWLSEDQAVVILACPDMLSERGKALGVDREIPEYNPGVENKVSILPIETEKEVTAGRLDKENANYVLKMLDVAASGCLSGEFAAMVTAPVHKGIINEAGFSFSGHTEYLAEMTGAKLPVMMLATEKLRVALATTHLPLAEVSQAITPELLVDILEILDHDLRKKYLIDNPHILICGLNPHAGEGGHLGKEEITIIEPVINQLRQKGLNLTGPLPADTLFTPRHLEGADAVLAMYHDQGLPVLKYAGFGKAINITLGLPVIRTSVDHGTALDLAGTGNVDTGSMVEAVKLASKLVALKS
jgi:4-hydroxythreonine-4-phosphate dehydrogenase